MIHIQNLRNQNQLNGDAVIAQTNRYQNENQLIQTSGSNAETEDISNWLNSMNMGKYFDVFIQNRYDKMKFVREIRDMTDLFVIGIVDKDDQAKLLLEIRGLQDEKYEMEQAPVVEYPYSRQTNH